MIRSISLILILWVGMSRLISGEVDAGTQALLADGNAALAQSDRDPSQNLVAALAFAKALPAYEAAGDSETVAELKSVIFWCKKRMDLGTLQRFVASKGDDGAVLTTAVAQVDQPVASSEAKDYLAKAEAYAQKNGGQHLKIAIRFFEVADRFQGTPESLKAQRLSLDALQQSMTSRRAADPILTTEVHAGAIAVGNLPEGTQKLIDQSNQAVAALAGKAAQDLAQDQRKAIDVVLKEAEAAQKRGDLDQVIAHQNQAANIDKEITGLSRSAAAAVDVYRKARSKNITKVTAEVALERKRLTQSLSQVQKDETKKGNTSGALAIKQVIESINRDFAAQANPQPAGGNGIRVIGDGNAELIWNNQAAIQLSTNPHTLSFVLKLPKPSKFISIRAKHGYGSERIIFTIEGRSDGKMAREYSAVLQAPKEVVKVVGEHAGSNDAFSYGPLQYKCAAEDEWVDIPLTSLAPVK